MELSHSFERSKIFYPFVMGYLSSVHGGLDSISRSITQELAEKGNDVEDMGLRTKYIKTPQELARFVGAPTTPLYFYPSVTLNSSFEQLPVLNFETELFEEVKEYGSPSDRKYDHDSLKGSDNFYIRNI